MKPSESYQLEQLTVKLVSNDTPLNGLTKHDPFWGKSFCFKISSFEPFLMTPFIKVETVNSTFQKTFE